MRTGMTVRRALDHARLTHCEHFGLKSAFVRIEAGLPIDTNRFRVNIYKCVHHHHHRKRMKHIIITTIDAQTNPNHPSLLLILELLNNALLRTIELFSCIAQRSIIQTQSIPYT